LRIETARDLLIDICRSLAAFGPQRFYVLNTGVSTVRALKPVAEVLANEGLTFHFTDLLALLGPIEHVVAEQEGGTHADEIETSMVLSIAPETVDMAKAAKDYHPGPGPLTRTPGRPGVYSPTGIYGDATLATAEKGRRVLEALVAGICADIEALRNT
jgi:creatinine amidohydrolase